ncbi:hypothetical protein MRB53_021404 [Persea americana]|uniref:Uncharacterized protein n=1 Tax=Persea americana TaxID=3435 RepID=A0ACC2L4T2_PERAE|nr:hypothetical protein MRB53_021404 [Persea americana]
MAQLLLLCFIFVHVSSSLASATGWFEPSPMVRIYPGPKGLIGSDPPATHGSMSQESWDEPESAEAPEIRRLGQHHLHHHSTDKSIAGAGLILGGLVTAIFAVIICYIRVTKRKNGVCRDPGQVSAFKK